MPYQAFHNFFPQVAKKETRVITIFDQYTDKVPAGEYSFVELFCNERDCDCRRVFFAVFASNGNEQVAVIAYGWESYEFYVKWSHEDSPDLIHNLQGPVLNLGSPQSDISENILEMFKMHLMQDDYYMERVKKHYKMFRSKVDKQVPLRAKKNKKIKWRDVKKFSN